MGRYHCFLEDSLYSIAELEKILRFDFIPQISFEDSKEQKKLWEKGMKKFKNRQISEDALILGEKFEAQIAAAYIPEVSVRWLDEKVGYGLFLEEPLVEGAYLGEYTGIVRKNERKYFEPINNFCYCYPIEDEWGRNYNIDATKGNLTRFINHSFSPNLQPYHVFIDGFFHLIFITLQRLEKGTQLTYDYGQNYWNIRSRPCSV